MPVNPVSVFQTLENDRREDTLSKTVATSAVKYQVSEAHPGYLVQIDEKNNTSIG